jgi:hypothetical protein
MTADVSVRVSLLGQDVGYGLFARRDFEEDERVAPFSGTVCRGEFPEDRDTRYAFSWEDPLRGPLYIDPTDCPAMFANDAEGPTQIVGLENNTYFNIDNSHDVHLRALRPIRAGEEIFVSYGPEYWGR